MLSLHIFYDKHTSHRRLWKRIMLCGRVFWLFWSTTITKDNTSISISTSTSSSSSLAGQFVVSGSWDHSLRLWDTERFVTVREINCSKVVNSVAAISVGGTSQLLFASAHPDKVVRVWDGRVSATGSVLQLGLRGHQAWVSAVDTGSTDHELVTVSLAENRTVL